MKSRFPFSSFPNGWFCVATSEELRPGKVIPLHYFGKDLVLFRTEDGKPHLLDAYCPHLGAHLGYGGRVQGNNIQCPFHGWVFNGNGHCINIPYAGKVPSKAQIVSWPIREVNGVILVYHHSQGEPPSWEIPELSEYSSKEWTRFRHVRRWKIRSHIQEVLENGVDIAHLPFLHSSSVVAVKNHTLKTNGSILFHSYTLTYNIVSTFAGIFGSKAEGSLKVISYGLGCELSRIHAKLLIVLKFLILLWITPIDEEYIDVRLVFSMKKVLNKPITYILEVIISNNVTRTVKEDFPLLEHKIYYNEPILCEGDGPLMQFRRWAHQFYSSLAAKIKP
ncbi:aromatic ring-hydroxylating dioxygenase subunit alpha [Nostoc sp. UHCC 0251]|uniref:aromatic ring-hydroxylating dioxygenase subunit alpha n=1 Tax=Nostoc sp. UHCC 0251 TaxID=3110240 RepID=UPI002B21031C|nr:aromatic ring-hydroxylating dioxygenase subunit alpha [Nostoc sp. UHCC 0251]MEA5622440.1 aromatic ring-hydroxylating dioxygenase subunit alpha [Nostoc sp. UHCC 0251]